MENFEAFSQDSSEIKEIDWVKQQVKAELLDLQKESFYATWDDGKVNYDMEAVTKYLTTIKQKNWSDLTSKNSSAWIMAVQIALEKRGIDVGKVDGIFGAGTSAAVRKFQKENGISEDGLPGPQTIAELLKGTPETPGTPGTPAGTTGTPVKTKETPANTTETPVKTKETPANTTETPANTTETPVKTKETPANTTETPANTTETPVKTKETPVNTTETPVKTKETPVKMDLKKININNIKQEILKNIKKKEENKGVVDLAGFEFSKREDGKTGLAYKEWVNPYLSLWDYKNWKLDWEGIAVFSGGLIYQGTFEDDQLWLNGEVMFSNGRKAKIEKKDGNTWVFTMDWNRIEYSFDQNFYHLFTKDKKQLDIPIKTSKVDFLKAMYEINMAIEEVKHLESKELTQLDYFEVDTNELQADMKGDFFDTTLIKDVARQVHANKYSLAKWMNEYRNSMENKHSLGDWIFYWKLDENWKPKWRWRFIVPWKYSYSGNFEHWIAKWKWVFVDKRSWKTWRSDLTKYEWVFKEMDIINDSEAFVVDWIGEMSVQYKNMKYRWSIKNGKYHGIWKEEWPDWSYYEWNFENWLKHGNMKYAYKWQEKAIYKYENGVLHHKEIS